MPREINNTPPSPNKRHDVGKEIDQRSVTRLLVKHNKKTAEDNLDRKS